MRACCTLPQFLDAYPCQTLQDTSISHMRTCYTFHQHTPYPCILRFVLNATVRVTDDAELRKLSRTVDSNNIPENCIVRATPVTLATIDVHGGNGSSTGDDVSKRRALASELLTGVGPMWA